MEIEKHKCDRCKMEFNHVLPLRKWNFCLTCHQEAIDKVDTGIANEITLYELESVRPELNFTGQGRHKL